MKHTLALLLVLRLLLLPSSTDCTRPTYVVQAGDTLGSIAEACGIPYTVILGINFHITDPNAIYPGQAIRLEAEAVLPTDTLPVSGAPVEGGPSLEENIYIVKPGDSLASISLMYTTTPAVLRALNPEIKADNIIYPGQVLILPGGLTHFPEPSGFVGVPATTVTRGQRILLNIYGFPPNAELDIRLRVYGANLPTVVYDHRTDAAGRAFFTVTIPSAARTGEQWVAEVSTTDRAVGVRATSARMTIR